MKHICARFKSERPDEWVTPGLLKEGNDNKTDQVISAPQLKADSHRNFLLLWFFCNRLFLPGLDLVRFGKDLFRQL